MRATSSTAPAEASMFGRPQLGRQQVPAAEHVQRQVAVAVVVAVEEPALLMAVQRIVGGVEVEDDLLRARRRCASRNRSTNSASIAAAVVADLVIARRLRPAQLQPVQRALAGQRRAVRPPRRELAGQHRQHRIVPQLIVVDQVLVAQRDAEHPLATSVATSCSISPGIAPIREAGGEPLDQPDRPVGRAQQQRAGIRGDRPAVERRHHRRPSTGAKSNRSALHSVGIGELPWQ